MWTPPNRVAVIARDCNDFDLFLVRSPFLPRFLLAVFVSPPHPPPKPPAPNQGHPRVQTLVKAVTLDGPLHLPPPLLPWRWTALAL